MALLAFKGFLVSTALPNAVEELGGVALLSWATTVFLVFAIMGGTGAHRAHRGAILVALVLLIVPRGRPHRRRGSIAHRPAAADRHRLWRILGLYQPDHHGRGPPRRALLPPIQSAEYGIGAAVAGLIANGTDIAAAATPQALSGVLVATFAICAGLSLPAVSPRWP